MKQEIAKLKSKLKEHGISIKQDKKIFSVHQDTKKYLILHTIMDSILLFAMVCTHKLTADFPKL